MKKRFATKRDRVHYSRDMQFAACRLMNPRFATSTIRGITCAVCRLEIQQAYDANVDANKFRRLLISECGTDDIAVLADAVAARRRPDILQILSERESYAAGTRPAAESTNNTGVDDVVHVCAPAGCGGRSEPGDLKPYFVAIAPTPELLERDVAIFVKQGYMPSGGVKMAAGEWAQAMVLLSAVGDSIRSVGRQFGL